MPKKKTDDKTLAARAAKIFHRYKTEKYFNWDIVDTKIQFSRKESVITDCEQYDGLYVIKSNVSKDLMTKREIVEAYKSLINVEIAFRTMKTVHLEIRPVYHRTIERIEAHVFICMLAYYLLWHMHAALHELYSDKSKDILRSEVIEILKTQQKFDLTIGDTEIKSQNVSSPSIIQQAIQIAVIGDIVVA